MEMIKELICTYHLAAKPSITHVVHFTLYVLLYVVCIVILYLLYLQEEVKSVNLRLFCTCLFTANANLCQKSNSDLKSP